MPQHKKSPRCSHDKCYQACNRTHSLEIAKVMKALEETSLSCSPLMPDISKEGPEIGMASVPEGCQSFSFSAIDIMGILSTKSGESSTRQEEEKDSSTSQAEPESQNVLLDAIDEKVAMLVNFMLLKYQMKEPITKEDMVKFIIEGYENRFPELLLRASEQMELVFGLDVKEVDPVNHHYVLLLKLGLTYDGMMNGEKGVPKTGILILVLGVIFMKGNRATEEEIWEVLNVTGIYAGVKHFIFGETRKLITKDFVREKYLICQRVANSRLETYEFLWGPRAYAETTKMKILEFLAKTHRTEPSSFPCQYEDALQDEKERSQGRISARASSLSVACAGSSANS